MTDARAKRIAVLTAAAQAKSRRRPKPPSKASAPWSSAASRSPSKPSNAKPASPTPSSTPTPTSAPASSTYAPGPSRAGAVRGITGRREHAGPDADRADRRPQEATPRRGPDPARTRSNRPTARTSTYAASWPAADPGQRFPTHPAMIRTGARHARPDEPAGATVPGRAPRSPGRAAHARTSAVDGAGTARAPAAPSASSSASML